MHKGVVDVYSVGLLNGEELKVKSSSPEKLDFLVSKGFINSYNLLKTYVRREFKSDFCDVDLDVRKSIKDYHRIFVVSPYLKG